MFFCIVNHFFRLVKIADITIECDYFRSMLSNRRNCFSNLCFLTKIIERKIHTQLREVNGNSLTDTSTGTRYDCHFFFCHHYASNCSMVCSKDVTSVIVYIFFFRSMRFMNPAKDLPGPIATKVSYPSFISLCIVSSHWTEWHTC